MIVNEISLVIQNIISFFHLLKTLRTFMKRTSLYLLMDEIYFLLLESSICKRLKNFR